MRRNYGNNLYYENFGKRNSLITNPLGHPAPAQFHYYMMTRIKFKSAAEAENVAGKLPIACKWYIRKDQTTDAYLEIPESYLEYVERYLLKK